MPSECNSASPAESGGRAITGASQSGLNGATEPAHSKDSKSMTKLQFRRRLRPARIRARTAGPPHRMAVASAFGLALLCALSATPAKAQHRVHPGGLFHGGVFPGGDFHGRDFGHFGPGELHVWRGGAWQHGWHDGRFAWWWVVGNGWYFYPEPIWPYPTYVPPALIVQQPPPVIPGVPPVQFWYFCDYPRGYYPHVATCSVPWRAVPVTSPK